MSKGHFLKISSIPRAKIYEKNGNVLKRKFKS